MLNRYRNDISTYFKKFVSTIEYIINIDIVYYLVSIYVGTLLFLI